MSAYGAIFIWIVIIIFWITIPLVTVSVYTIIHRKQIKNKCPYFILNFIITSTMFFTLIHVLTHISKYTWPYSGIISIMLSVFVMYKLSIIKFFANGIITTEKEYRRYRMIFILMTLSVFVIVFAIVLNNLYYHSANKCEIKSSGEKFHNSIGMVLIKTTGGYWVGTYEVTQKEFEKVMGYNPSYSKNPDQPVEGVTWQEAEEFCRKLTELEKDKYSDYIYGLPTVKQWNDFAADAKLEDSVVPTKDKKYNHPQPVGTMKSNCLGIYDVRGNVWEYCSDWYYEKGYGEKWKVTKGASFNARSDFLDLKNEVSTLTPKSFDAGFRVIRKNKGDGVR